MPCYLVKSVIRYSIGIFKTFPNGEKQWSFVQALFP